MQTADQIRAARDKVLSAVAAYEAFESCLYNGLAVLRGDWAAKGHAPDAIIETAVAEIVVDRRQSLALAINRVNEAALRIDASLPQHDQGIIAPIGSIGGTIVNSDYPAPAAAPPGAPRLTIPEQLLASSSNCGQYYPPIALKKGEQGQVEVGFDIDATGKPFDVHILRSSGFDDLDGAAIVCVSRYRHTPAIAGGVAVPTTGEVHMIDFLLG